MFLSLLLGGQKKNLLDPKVQYQLITFLKKIWDSYYQKRKQVKIIKKTRLNTNKKKNK